VSKVADVALSDFSFFISHYINKKLWRCQESWADKFQTVVDSDHWKALQLLAPADHGKTSTIVVPGILWLLTRDLNTRIGLIGNTDPYAQQIVRLVMGQIDRNPLLEKDFQLRRGPQWSVSEGIIIDRPNWDDKSPSLLGVGVGADVQSQRFDYLFTDDMATRKNSRSEGQRDQLRSYFFTDALSRLDKTDTTKNKVFIFGHRVESSDVYQAQHGKKDYLYVCDKAIIDDSTQTILAPEGHTYEELSEARKDDPVGFELVFQQQAVATGKFITRQSMEKCRRPELKFHMNSLSPEARSQFKFTWISLDPAFTQSRWSSFMVMMLWGLKHDGKTRTLLWAGRDKLLPESLLPLMEMKFRLYRPDHFLIESNQAQLLLQTHMQKVFPNDHSKFKKVPTVNPDGRLDEELAVMFDLFQCDPPLVEIPYHGATEQAFAHTLTEEFLGFPDFRHRDTIMSMYVGEKGLGLIKQETRTGYLGRGIVGSVSQGVRNRLVPRWRR
jgi:hypothetical protein